MIWALRRAFQAVETEKEQQLRSTGLAGAHYSVLVNVGARPGITGADLARRLHVTAQNVAGLVAKLTDRGLLRRHPHPVQKNILEIHLTALGQETLDHAERIVSSLEDNVRQLLGEQVASIVTDSLDRIAKEISRKG